MSYTLVSMGPALTCVMQILECTYTALLYRESNNQTGFLTRVTD